MGLTLGTTASSSSSGTCTTLTTMVSWTRTTSNVWPFATPSSKAKVTGMRPLSRRTKRSWLTCGTRSPSWLTSTRMAKSKLMSSKKESSFHAREKITLIFPMLSNISLTLNSEPLTLTVTVPLVLPNSELTAKTGWLTRALANWMPPTKNCSTMTIRRLEALPLLVTKSCTLNSSETPMNLAPPSTSSAPFRRSPKLKTSELFTVHHAMISYFRRFSIHHYNQDMNFFLPSANSSVRPKTGPGAGRTLANIKDKNDAVSRRANSFGISTTWRLLNLIIRKVDLLFETNSQQ